MSLIGRVAALVLFVMVLVGERSPVQGSWTCDFHCDTIYFFPPEWDLYCWDMMCVDTASCETDCRMDDCTEDEAGARIDLWCQQ